MAQLNQLKPYYNTIVVIPVGPGSCTDFIADTINSFIYYNQLTYRIILADDSHQGIGTAIASYYPGVEVIPTRKPMGGWAGLYITLALAFRHAIENYRFSVLLKLDTDALVIGSNPQQEILQHLTLNPLIGIAGQYPLDYHGKPWNIKWPQQRILNGTRTWKFFRRPIANWQLIKLYRQALKNGYLTGESVFGGAYFMSEALLIKLFNSGLLPNYSFLSLNLGEDHIFSLLAKSLGFDLENLSSNGLPFGCAWKGLPVSPEKLLQDKKKIIHSVRFWNDLNEAEIRTYFKNRRDLNSQFNIPDF
ncbi:MAG: hypothetical protein JWR67_1407 [Mucilaginibacter sp.]|nr:hypothetical protein [Mucilaginibacter sp.]